MSMINKDIDISIIIVNWNCGQDIINCIESIQATIKRYSYEVIVVDNNSSDGSKEAIKGRYQFVNVIENDYNNMFAGANNQGYEIAKGKYIFILNPDTIVIDESVDNLTDILVSGCEKVVTCTLLNKDGTIQYKMHRGFPSFLRLFSSMLYNKIGFLKLLPSVKNYLLLNNKFDNDFYVDQAAGAVILFNRSVIDRLGYLFDDKNFPLLYNDVDLCYRLSKLKIKILCKTDIKIYHLKGQSLKKIPKKEYIIKHVTSFMLFTRKHRMIIDYNLARIANLIIYRLWK